MLSHYCSNNIHLCGTILPPTPSSVSSLCGWSRLMQQICQIIEYLAAMETLMQACRVEDEAERQAFSAPCLSWPGPYGQLHLGCSNLQDTRVAGSWKHHLASSMSFACVQTQFFDVSNAARGGALCRGTAPYSSHATAMAADGNESRGLLAFIAGYLSSSGRFVNHMVDPLLLTSIISGASTSACGPSSRTSLDLAGLSLVL